MPLINLIKEQRIQAQKREQQVRIALVGTLGVGALCLITTAALLLDGARLTIVAAAMEKQKQEMEPKLAQLDEYETQIQELQPRVTTLETAQTFSGKWGVILDHLTTNMPEGAILTDLKAFQQDPEKPVMVTFSGLSTTQETVGELILRLETCPELQNVTLKYTQPRVTEGGTLLNYELEGQLVGTGAEDVAPKEVNG